MSELSVNVVECPACGQKHEALDIQSFKTASPPWTHWYTCPVNGDPVPITLDTKGSVPIEVNNTIIQSLVKAQETGAYLTAVFRSKDGEVILERTSHQFPTTFESKDGKSSTFDDVLSQLLRDDLRKDIGPPPRKEPLAIADVKAEPIDLFGDSKPNEG